MSRGGTCPYHLYVQLENPKPGEAKNVILGALATHYDIKHVTVVDIDVDVHDPTESNGRWRPGSRPTAISS